MNSFGGLQTSGTETHARKADEISTTPSQKLLHNIARLLETEPEDIPAKMRHEEPEAGHDARDRHEGWR